MSPDSAVECPPALREIPQPEHRLHRRYPIVLPVQYKILHQISFVGSGKTLNISSGGIFFEAEDHLPLALRSKIELVLRWPFLLEGRRPLKLVVHGRVVRSDATGTAVQVTSHEFRTRKRQPVAAITPAMVAGQTDSGRR